MTYTLNRIRNFRALRRRSHEESKNVSFRGPQMGEVCLLTFYVKLYFWQFCHQFCKLNSIETVATFRQKLMEKTKLLR